MTSGKVMFFSYQARTKEGEIIRGEIEAVSEDAAAEILLEKDWQILSLKEKRKFVLPFFLQFLAKVSRKDLIVFSRQLAIMVAANVPLVEALAIVAQQTANENFRRIINKIAAEVEGGAKLSSAFSAHPAIFSEFFVSIVKSGEISGRLEEVLEYLADQQERDYELMNKIRGAMIYPAFILAGLVVVGVLMMVFVVPKLTGILKESGAPLPLATRILIGTSDFFVNYWWLMLLLVIFLAIFGQFYTKTKKGKAIWDFFKIKIPIFGPLLQKIYLTRFTRSLATLIIGGVDLVQGLNVVGEVVGNTVYQDLIEKTKQEVEDGHSIVSVFRQSKEIPPMLCQMMAVGEETGKIDEVLEKLSAFYSREIENTVRNLVSIIEPVIIMVLGIAVGVMVAAIIMPMYQLAAQF